MVDRRVYVKNIRSWFNHWDTINQPQQLPPRVDRKEDLILSVRDYFHEVTISVDNPVYLFTSQAWFYGIKTLSNPTIHYSDGSARVVSITPVKDYAKRKIVDRIKISCDKNIVAKNAEMLEFTILRVKMSIYDINRTNTNGLRKKWYATPPLVGFKSERNDLKDHINEYICDDDLQLVNKGSFFSSSEVVLSNLDYELGLDDLVLIQKISFDKNIEAGTVGKDSRDLHFGIARKQYADYKIEVEYSYGYM